jgi:hypothetical protein
METMELFGYPLKSNRLAEELKKRSDRTGATKKHASILAKLKVAKKFNTPKGRKKSAGTRHKVAV